jgi:hypothetical protein
LTVAGEAKIHENRLVSVIYSNVVNGGVALSDYKLFDVFSPVREDEKNI